MRSRRCIPHPKIFIPGIIAVLAEASGCTFDLAEVEYGTADAGTSDVHVDALAVDAPPDKASAVDVLEEDALMEAEQVDGCWPPSDTAVCLSNGCACGALDTTDACGQARSVVCGTCSLEAHCEQGTCIDYGYAWKTAAWSSCSEPCDGGTQSRAVWCERDDGLTVNDGKCAGAKPADTASCNTTACHPPTGMVVVDPPLLSDTQIGLSWQPVAEATEYAVLWSSALGDGVDTTTNTWYIIDTDTSFDHWVSIYPCNSAGCGAPTQFGPLKK